MDLAGILFDMDGVLYNGDQPIAGAVETIQWVRTERIPHLFVTNATSRSRAHLTSKLGSFGIPSGESDILTPGVAAADWLRANRAGPVALFVPPAALPEFAGLARIPDDGASFVVVGDLGEGWDYRTLNRAFRLLHNNPQSQLIALGMTRYWMSPDGIALDVAPFVVALEHAARTKAIVFGKPDTAFFEAAAARLRLVAGRILMVGDDIEADVGGAKAAGLKAAIVQTGKFRSSDLDGPIHPDFVLESIRGLPVWWEGNRAA